MSDGRRFALMVAVALGSLGVWPETHSWLTFTVRPFVVLIALVALAPWHAES